MPLKAIAGARQPPTVVQLAQLCGLNRRARPALEGLALETGETVNNDIEALLA